MLRGARGRCRGSIRNAGGGGIYTDDKEKGKDRVRARLNECSESERHQAPNRSNILLFIFLSHNDS